MPSSGEREPCTCRPLSSVQRRASASMGWRECHFCVLSPEESLSKPARGEPLQAPYVSQRAVEPLAAWDRQTDRQTDKDPAGGKSSTKREIGREKERHTHRDKERDRGQQTEKREGETEREKRERKRERERSPE